MARTATVVNLRTPILNIFDLVKVVLLCHYELLLTWLDVAIRLSLSPRDVFLQQRTANASTLEDVQEQYNNTS